MILKATLRTRCGCWQHRDVPCPPPVELLVKLKPRPIPAEQPISAEQVSAMVIEFRRFALRDWRVMPDGYADYEENS